MRVTREIVFKVIRNFSSLITSFDLIVLAGSLPKFPGKLKSFRPDKASLSLK